MSAFHLVPKGTSRSNIWRRRIACLTVAALLASVSAAAAEPSAEDRVTARELAGEGYRALKSSDYEVAADRFRRADALVHAPTLLVDLARSLVGLGRFVEAHETYERVLREGVTDNVPWSWKKAYENASKEQKKLEPRLAWVVIQVTGHDSPRVKIDGKELPAAAVGVRRAIDPGQRTIVARADGFLPAEQTLDVSEGASTEVTLQLEPDPNAGAEQAEPAVSEQQAEDDQAPARDNTLAYVAFGVAGAGFITAGVSGGLMLNERSALEDVCLDGKCPSSATDSLSTYHTYGTIAAIGAAVGVAGAITGVSLLLLAPSARKPGGEQAHVTPLLAPGYVGMKGSF